MQCIAKNGESNLLNIAFNVKELFRLTFVMPFSIVIYVTMYFTLSLQAFVKLQLRISGKY